MYLLGVCVSSSIYIYNFIPTHVQSFQLIFQVTAILRKYQNPEKYPRLFLRNHHKFLHFLIHIDVLMLCKKFELILS